MRYVSFGRFWHYISIITLSGLLSLWGPPVSRAVTPGLAQAASDPVIAAAGDIACDPSSSSFNNGNGTSGSCRQKYTSDLLVNAGLAAVLALGDNQYYCGGYQAFLQAYDPSWGRVKSITRPAVGNHEYLTSGGTDCTSANTGAAGYFNYFGSAAGNPSQGYYSFNIGEWHLIALNSNCSSAGGCGSSSPQGQWLVADLAAHPNYCTLAYWHIPLFSSGGRASSNTQSIWNTLYNNNVDVVLSSHDHIYERFAPQTPSGTLDNVRGIRAFIVGSGGANHTSLATIAANSQVRNTDTYGVLKMTLHPTSYSWQFVPEAGKTFTDSGTANCHGAVPANTPSATSTAGPIPSPSPTSNATATNTPVPTTAGSVFTFTPLADAHVAQGSPGTNYGSATILQTDNSPVRHILLRFNVTGITGQQIASAKLRLYNVDPSGAGGDFYRVGDNTWQEGTVTWDNAPAADPTLLGSLGSVAANTWYEVDLTSAITAAGTYSLKILSTSSNGADYSSKEGLNAPQLVIQTQNTATLTATRTPTSTPTSTFTTTPTLTSTFTPTASPSATNTFTPTVEPSATNTFTSTAEPSATNTFTESPTLTPTFTPIAQPSATDTFTSTAEPSATDTFTPTAEPSATNIGSPSPTLPSTATNTPVPTTAGSVFTFTPLADAYVAQGSPGTNAGTATTLQTDNSPVKHILLKFNVTGITGQQIASAKLRLYNVDPASAGGDFYQVGDNTWQESTVTWDNAPAADPTLLGSWGTVAANTWYEVDLTSAITAAGTYSLKIISTSSNGADYSSKEGLNPPQLVIQTQNGPTLTATRTPTSTPTSTSTATPTLTSTFTPTASPSATDTFTPTVEPSATNTFTSTAEPSATNTFTESPTLTPTFMPIAQPSATDTFTPTVEPSATDTFTTTPTLTSSFTPIAEPSATNTFTETPTFTPTDTAIPTDTPTLEPAPTLTESPTSIPSPTDTPTIEPSSAPTATSTPPATNTPDPSPSPTQAVIPTATAVNTPAPITFAFVPEADAYVDESTPTTIRGTGITFRIDGSPIVRSYIRFNIQGLSGTVTRVTLRIYANSKSTSGYTVSSVSDNTWSEATLNYNNAPPFGNMLGSSTAFLAGEWTMVDLTGLVNGNGVISVVLNTSSSTAVSLASRESGANAPQLIIETLP